MSAAAPAIIERKLSAPPLAERVVARPRLERLIGLLVERYPVVWVAATAGAGKTTAVVQAARSGNRPVAWLTVDATDAAPGRLVTYLEAALARQRPKLDGTATRALAQRAPHAEAAGLLAEAIGDEPLVVVLDELERLADAPEALAVLSAFVRYAPPTTRIVLITRRELALELGVGQGLGRVAAVGEGELAFTDDEAAQALAGAGRTADDVGAVVEATGGWVTGVLFEAWRSADHIAGLGGEADPLNGYLSSQILGQLEPGDREFLITTAVLDEVTPERAEALAPQDAHRLAGLRNAHLPVAWTTDGRTMRCHPRFREYLLERLRLAEAEWRAGDEDAADRAADLALAAAGQQGSNHILLQALADFPAVVARRIDAEPLGGSPWHELGRALAAQGVVVGPQLGAVIELHEFGRRAITVDGAEVRPRIAKAYELLAALAAAPRRAVGREALLEGLFDGRTDESARAYLRQAVHRLREVLPDGVELVADASGVAFPTGVVVSSESARFERLLAEAARLQGEERLHATTDALALVDAGEYLPGARSVWVDARREHLAELAADARLAAAELQFALGGYSEAGALVAAVLARDPYREAAWRLQMRLAGAVGDEDRVIAAYRRCEQALDRLGTTPSETTRRLLDALRR